jgi:proteasome lid subunit RPN8/RPN11
MLQRKLDQEWMPSRIDFKGFCHSHPNGFERLSAGDLRYIERLLVKNPDMPLFAAPIVIPEQFRLRAIVVLREQPGVARFTHFQMF